MTRTILFSKMKQLSIWLDIRFWLLFFFVIRLFGITNAPLEMGHNWRQSLTNMVARNFLEGRANLFYPVIDIAGEKTGIIGTEFPFFNYLIYIVSSVFGYAHWYGRAINLVVTTIGVYYFYKLIKSLFNERLAFFSAFILCISVWFGFGRKMMPDTFSVALVIIGTYFGYRYLVEAKLGSLIGFFVFCTLGILCKIPALSLFSIFGIVAFSKSVPIKRTILLYSAGTVSFAIVSLWYFYWVPHLVSTYDFELYFPRSFSQGLKEVLDLWPQLIEKFYFVAFSSFIAFATFLGGVFYVVRDREKLKMPLFALGIVSVVFVLFIVKTGLVFPLHSYYVVPFVPVMALVAAYFFTCIKSRYAYVILALITIESVANQHDDMLLTESEMYKLSLEEIVDKYVPKENLIIVNGTQSPQLMYFAHRKGWTEDSEVIREGNYVNEKVQKGAKYLLWDLVKGDLPAAYGKTVYADENIAIVKLHQKLE